MQPHPDFAGSTLPRSANLGLFQLTPLAPAAAEEDFAVVTRSVAVLRGFFGNDWPLGLTLADNHIDMAWHERLPLAQGQDSAPGAFFHDARLLAAPVAFG